MSRLYKIKPAHDGRAAPPASPPPASPPLRGAALRAAAGEEMVAIVTLVLWSLCFVVGVLGVVLPYGSFRVPAPELRVARTEIVNVKIEKEPAPPKETVRMPPPEIAASSIEPAPAAPAPVTVAEAPAAAVALPSPAIAFAVPTESYARIADAAEASHGGARGRAGSAGEGNAANGSGGGNGTGDGAAKTVAPVTRLTFGQGEGKQPAPEYPRDAVIAGQEGSVTVQFTVDEAGRVTSVATTSASRWPLLNQAALRVIRQKWHFAPGVERSYEVVIQFQLER